MLDVAKSNSVTRRMLLGGIFALIMGLALFSVLSTQNIASAQIARDCLVKGNSYSVYAHIIDASTGKSLKIVSAKDFLAPSGSKGSSLYVDFYVNTNSQGDQGQVSACPVSVPGAHDFLWEAINGATNKDYNTQGVSLLNLGGEPIVYQFVNGGATAQACRVSDTSVSSQYTYSRIIDQNGQGLGIVKLDYYKVNTNGHERLWVWIWVSPSSTFNPSLSGAGKSCSISVNNFIFKWRIQISGKSTYQGSSAEAFGGFFSTYPDIQQAVG